ncbi:MAG: imidazole glycerol phosphate synthase subunit HisH [Chitinophagia bacterium]|nr:imidazole glycerol phosphate synthase subunit HisH [Chitinophagia bacterium]
MKKIAVLDYGIGNVRSVKNAFAAVGAQAEVTRDKKKIKECDGLILPGVGSFPEGMALLLQHSLLKCLIGHIHSGKPLLGICLGMQLLFERGTEFRETEGLGVIPGEIMPIPVKPSDGRLPHIAWTKICFEQSNTDPMFFGISASQARFYFTHSYTATQVPSSHVTGITYYLGQKIIASVRHKNVWGTQFHPEKSGPSGLKVLENFVRFC